MKLYNRTNLTADEQLDIEFYLGGNPLGEEESFGTKKEMLDEIADRAAVLVAEREARTIKALGTFGSRVYRPTAFRLFKPFCEKYGLDYQEKLENYAALSRIGSQAAGREKERGMA